MIILFIFNRYFVSNIDIIEIKIIEENLNDKQKMLSQIDKFSKDLKNGTKV